MKLIITVCQIVYVYLKLKKKSKIFMIHRWSLLARCSFQILMGGQPHSQVTQGKPIDKACLEGCGASEREIVIEKGRLLIVKS